MNKSRRSKLEEAVGYLSAARSIVESARYEEEDCLANMPDNMESGERYEKMESAVECLDSAADSIEEAIERIEEAKA